MRNYSIYACAVTIRIVVGFAVLVFAYKFDFPPFMVLIIALLNDGTIMTLSVDRVLPSMTPDHWDLAEICPSFHHLVGRFVTIELIVWFRFCFSHFCHVLRVVPCLVNYHIGCCHSGDHFLPRSIWC